MSELRIVPVSIAEAKTFVRFLHRHHGPPPGAKFALGVADGDQIVGVAMVGRPVARHFDDGLTAEVSRTATDGTSNANSMLYGAAWAGRQGPRVPPPHHLHPGRRVRLLAASCRVARDRGAVAPAWLGHPRPAPHSSWGRRRRPHAVGGVVNRRIENAAIAAEVTVAAVAVDTVLAVIAAARAAADYYQAVKDTP